MGVIEGDIRSLDNGSCGPPGLSRCFHLTGSAGRGKYRHNRCSQTTTSAIPIINPKPETQ